MEMNKKSVWRPQKNMSIGRSRDPKPASTLGTLRSSFFIALKNPANKEGQY